CPSANAAEQEQEQKIMPSRERPRTAAVFFTGCPFLKCANFAVIMVVLFSRSKVHFWRRASVIYIENVFSGKLNQVEKQCHKVVKRQDVAPVDTIFPDSVLMRASNRNP
ncbi:MAG: hypothetical protein D3909_10785, partial [Candidatus Electrothrix sp. ATG1]|nr:hypothetical protein [Candidatus Electrothrix sp. ATG1]